MGEESAISHVNDIDLDKLNPRLHNECWVVSDSRRWHGNNRINSLVQGGAIFSEEAAKEMAVKLNQMVFQNTLGGMLTGVTTKVTGPFYAYRLSIAKGLGLLPQKK